MIEKKKSHAEFNLSCEELKPMSKWPKTDVQNSPQVGFNFMSENCLELSSYFQSQILSDILSYWNVQDVVESVDWPTLKVFAFLI